MIETQTASPQRICPLNYTLSIIGQKWKMPILWHLGKEEVLRYSEIKRKVGGITNIMLTKSLQELEEHGLVRREQYEEIPPHVEYSLTQRGRTLMPILRDMYAWGADQQEIDGRAAENNCQTI